jgi:hypothetical protein
MMAALEVHSFEILDAKESLQNFLMVRQRFFQENPNYANIFFNAVLQPPKHLAASEMFNSYFQKKAEQNGDYRELIDDHEGRLSAIFDIMLYGVAKEPTGGAS